MTSIRFKEKSYSKTYRSTTKPSFHKSFQLSQRSHQSEEKKNKSLINNEEIDGVFGQPLSFYFDEKARKKIVLKTVNKYIEPNKNPEEETDFRLST